MARLTIPVHVRWADIDAYGHVNNAAVLTLLEEARIAVFWAGRTGEEGGAAARLDAGPGASTATFIARQEVEYLAPLPYTMEPLPLQLWMSRLGGASIDVCYELPGADGAVAVRAATTIVLVDPTTGRPRRITDEERAAWEPQVEDPVVFRRR